MSCSGTETGSLADALLTGPEGRAAARSTLRALQAPGCFEATKSSRLGVVENRIRFEGASSPKPMTLNLQGFDPHGMMVRAP